MVLVVIFNGIIHAIQIAYGLSEIIASNFHLKLPGSTHISLATCIYNVLSAGGGRLAKTIFVRIPNFQCRAAGTTSPLTF